MHIRIVRPLPHQLEGVEVGHLLFGASYHIEAPLCDLLIVTGYAVPLSLDDDGPGSRTTTKPSHRTRQRLPGKRC
jgi:hypothetical protein